VALAGVDHHQPRRPPGCQQALRGRDGAAQLTDIVAQCRAEAAGLQEIALHVDHQQRRRGGAQREGIGLGLDRQRAGNG
jgi:hypothetical protein